MLTGPVGLAWAEGPCCGEEGTTREESRMLDSLVAESVTALAVTTQGKGTAAHLTSERGAQAISTLYIRAMITLRIRILSYNGDLYIDILSQKGDFHSIYIVI